MNATYNMDHLQAITHVTSLLNTGAKLGGAATVNKPKTAATSHYDPTGQEVATTSATSYAGVTFAADGSIAGGSLSHEVSIPGGNKLSTTTLAFGPNGKPGSAQITVHNRDGNGDFKHHQMDMSGATWNESFAITSGAVKLTTTDAATGQKSHDGAIQFANEAVSTGAFTHYATDGSGAVTGGSQVDYSGAKFSGANIIGGQYTVNTHSVVDQSQSSSIITVSPLGRVQSIETTNTKGGLGKEAVGAVATKVLVDFSNVVFNARNEFDSGEIVYTANDKNGNLLSKTTVSYAGANPLLSTTEVYKNGQLQNKIVIDYAASLFNNDHQVVNSSKKVDTYSGDGKLVSSVVISYDAKGVKTTETPAKDVQMKAVTRVVQHVKTAPPPKLTAVNEDGTTRKCEYKYRDDKTMEEARTTITDKDGKPISVELIFFAADGRTMIRSMMMDLSGLNYDQTSNTATGSMDLQTYGGANGGMLKSGSTIQY